MTGTPSERAAALSARIHRDIRLRSNSGETPGDITQLGDLSADEYLAFWLGTEGLEFVGHRGGPFFRLGAELRAIAAGNREANRG